MTKLPELINAYADARIDVAFKGKQPEHLWYDIELKLSRARMALEFELHRVTGRVIKLEEHHAGKLPPDVLQVHRKGRKR